MDLMKLSFGSFDFDVNPETLIISGGENMENTSSTMFYLGTKQQSVKGEGYFFGSDCAAKFEQLSKIAKDGANYLILPKLTPFYAVLTELRAQFLPDNDLLKYDFIFVEANEKSSVENNCVLYAKQGDRLWDFVGSKSIDWLVSHNRHIRHINNLKEGEQVVIR